MSCVPLVNSALFFAKTEMPLQLTINGQVRENLTSQNLAELVIELGIQDSHFAIALNYEVIPHSKFETTKINEGDKIEIVHAVGGGA